MDLSLAVPPEGDLLGSGQYAELSQRLGNLETGLPPVEYDDLVGAPDLGTAAAADVDDFATAAQGNAVAGKVAKGELAVNVKDYGAKGDGTTDDTAAIRAAFASSGRNFVFPPGTYKITIPQDQSLGSFTGKSGITIDASAATLDNSSVSYTSDPLTPIFLFDACTDVSLTLGNYIGFTLPTPLVHHGYRGATLVRAINGTSGVRVDARATNLRYGVQTGEYGDPSKGGCKNFDVKIRGTMIGYPLAAYLAEGIRHDIDVDGVHRGVYIGGCSDVRGVLRFKDQYIADLAYLITDALVSGTDAAAQLDPVGAPTTSRGSSQVDIEVIEKGSTQMAVSSSCAGLGLSRVDPGTVFSDIRIKVHTVGTDTISRYFGGAKVASGANSVWSRYPFNWEPTILLRNIELSGVVDHSAQTLSSNTAGDFYFSTTDTGHSATVQGLIVRDMVIRKSSGALRNCYLYAPGLVAPAVMDRVDAPGHTWEITTNSNVPLELNACRTGQLLAGGSKLSLVESTVDSLHSTNTDTSALQSTVGGMSARIRHKEVTLALTGASVTWAGAIPSATILLGVHARIQSTITGATGYNLGVAGDISRFANRNDLAAGLAIGPGAQAATEVSPKWYLPTTDVIVTAKTSNFTAGSIRVILSYIAFTPPTV